MVFNHLYYGRFKRLDVGTVDTPADTHRPFHFASSPLYKVLLLHPPETRPSRRFYAHPRSSPQPGLFFSVFGKLSLQPCFLRTERLAPPHWCSRSQEPNGKIITAKTRYDHRRPDLDQLRRAAFLSRRLQPTTVASAPLGPARPVQGEEPPPPHPFGLFPWVPERRGELQSSCYELPWRFCSL